MKLVILDLDGVVLESKKAMISAMRATMNTCNIHWKWSDDAAWQMRGLSRFRDMKETFKALIAISIGYANLDDIMAQDSPEEEIQLVIDSFLTPNYESMAEGMHDEYFRIRKTAENADLETAFPYATEAIDLLSKKFRLAIVSSAKREQMERKLAKLPKEKFAIAVGADDVTKDKPDPEGILKICSTLGVPPQEAWMIGDSLWDIDAATAAGCKSVAVLSGMAQRKDLERGKPGLMFNNLLEAAQHLCK